ncbi:MAG: cytochrome P450 [Scytonematopsis contorta HA4267-MV1]|nr:cytochrome P450 [Scytonematopsis contorta HA4267-MV1]
MKWPDGPQTPALLQSINLVVNPLKYLDKCAKYYGDIFTIRFLSYPPVVVISNPQGMEEIFTANPKQFNSGEANRMLPRTFSGDSSLLVLDGNLHQRRKRMLTPPFHGERMRAYGQLICDITKQVMMQWKIDEPFHVQPSMQDISLQVILRAIFGLNEGTRFQHLKKLLNSLVNLLSDPWSASILFFRTLQQDWGPWSLWGRFVRLRQQVDEIIYAEIKRRRNDPSLLGEDILSLMMTARDESGELMTDVELRDELMILLIGGHETTAMSMTWALYWIHHLPKVYENLMVELDTFGSDLEPTAIARLPYLNAICQETLRIYPTVIFTSYRIVQEPVKIMGYQFEPGTFLSPCVYLTHKREDLYPEPNHFRPERFLERQFSPYEFLPFGGGNRRCLGKAFALFEMKLVLATILVHLKLVLADLPPVKPVRKVVTVAPSKMYLIPTEEKVSTSNTLVYR